MCAGDFAGIDVGAMAVAGDADTRFFEPAEYYGYAWRGRARRVIAQAECIRRPRGLAVTLSAVVAWQAAVVFWPVTGPCP